MSGETDWRGELLWAIEELDVDRVAELATGHDLNFVGEHGHTPLMAAVDTTAQGAVQRGLAWDVTVVELLLSLHASPTLKGHHGTDAADLARTYHWHEAIDAMRTVDPDGVPSLFWPLGYVSRTRYRDITPDEDTPWRAELMDAIKRTDIERVRGLLAAQQGTLDFVHPGSNLTPLQLAIDEQNDEYRPTHDATIVRLLLAAGADPGFPDDPWSSPRKRAERWPEVAALLDG